MISKIRYIKNLAVFNNFDWDTEVKDKDGNSLEFKEINIIYGRNYSGKTTLSRIFSAMESGIISDKYENPECCVLIDNNEVTQNDFLSHDKTIRVFNEDFIRDNLGFIINPDENVEPFAILGEDNKKVKEEIEALENKLGVNEKDKETGLYKDLNFLQVAYNKTEKDHQKAESDLNSQLSTKATGEQGIKYNSEKFGDQNYNITKIRHEINFVKGKEFNPISNEDKSLAEELILEQAKEVIPDMQELTLSFDTFSGRSKELIEKEISQSDKIENLIEDAVLNRWVKEGRDQHQKNKLDTCAFCNNEIKDSRWSELDKHFDEESDKLEKEIIRLIDEIKGETESLQSLEIPKKDNFYSKYSDNFSECNQEFNSSITNYKNSLNELVIQLEARKNDIINVQKFRGIENVKSKVDTAIKNIRELIVTSNKYTEKLSEDKTKAKDNLRLREVYDFISTIEYDKQMGDIATLKGKLSEEERKRDKKKTEINELKRQISEKKLELKDESNGADTINKLLNNYFGHYSLSLKSIEFKNGDTDSKQYRFEIHRGDKKAYHLSQGENSLIAFCYFIAKLQDVETKEKNPIIWIDDPISSLDSNHIFFIYTLIKTQIYDTDDFEQLFISTHNLNFLKYLKRFYERKKKSQCLIIHREDNNSIIKLMPDYLKNDVSEFRYLFDQIYKCSNIKNIDDSNYTAYYNFCNNARKFLELFLYYKYPDSTKQIDKIKKFFGDESILVDLTNRLNNEYSHLTAVLERGEKIVEVPEMHTVAKLIVDTIEKTDKEQYNALVREI